MKTNRRSPLITAASTAVLLSCCVDAPTHAAAAAKPLACDDSLKTAFKPDELTTVVAVKAFKKGDPLLVSGTPTEKTPRAANDLCMIKLNVGPGNPGPTDAPSTSAGIGIEVWLPTAANWNGRIHNFGGNGWSGGVAGSPTLIANLMNSAATAATEGAVTSTCDSGHSGVNPARPEIPGAGGAFGMDPGGTLSKAQWRDFSWRSMQQQALKTTALATAYYGRAPKYSYFDGTSQGGRQGLKLAQQFPELFDGVVATAPAINWMRFSLGYTQAVTQHDLGGVPLTEAQQDLVSMAAIHACDVVGGQHLGYVMDPAACRYDPTQDTNVRCTTDGGKNTTPDCVTRVQARAINKMWYGVTADGSVPSPAIDNGWDKDLEGVHRWFGPARGASLYNASLRKIFPTLAIRPPAGAGRSVVGSDWVALVLQDPKMAGPDFKNASGDGQGLSSTLSYAQLDDVLARGLAMQPAFEHFNSDNPDLSAFKARGRKLLTVHGLDDVAIPVQGTIRYYKQVAEKLGGLANVQSFYKLYLIPGVGHQLTLNGTANPDANPPRFTQQRAYELMVNWVENGVVPSDRIDIESPPGTPDRITQPVCLYPQKPKYKSGDPRVATSYTCS
jgi:pimeloyl-ACP methyl ester carboxylesterase